MKLTTAMIMVLLFSSCGKIQKIMDGTENLPNQIEETNNGMRKTNEAIRKQKIGEAFKIMIDENNRKTLAPIPSNMMSAAKTMAEALTVDETLLFVKNYLIKVNEEIFADTYPWIDAETEEGQIAQIKFMLNKAADLQMVTLISGFLPDDTVLEMVEQESEQGAYRNVMVQILKMRSNFYNDVMLDAGMIGGDKKLETLGQIDKAIEYGDKLDYICNLVFVDQIALKITGFSEKQNESLSKPVDKDLALIKWKKIQEKATDGFKAQSFFKDPATNEAAVEEYTVRYKAALEKIQKRIDAYAK